MLAQELAGDTDHLGIGLARTENDLRKALTEASVVVDASVAEVLEGEVADDFHHPVLTYLAILKLRKDLLQFLWDHS